MAHAFLKEFFALYKSLPCLWNKNDPRHNDKFERDLAMIELTKKYRELSPDATTVSVRKELFTFKGHVRKEHARRKEAQKAGLPVDSRVWYYDDLSFLHETAALKPAANRKVNNSSMSDFKEKILMPSRVSTNISTPAPNRQVAPATKKTDLKDRFDVLAEKLRSLPTEQSAYIECIIENIFKFADHENEEWMRTSSTVASRHEAPRPVAANTKPVQRMPSKTVGTQTTSNQTVLETQPTRHSPCPRTPPNMFTQCSAGSQTPRRVPANVQNLMRAVHSQNRSVPFVSGLNYVDPNQMLLNPYYIEKFLSCDSSQ